MKKFIALCLALLMALSLVACGQESSDEGGEAKDVLVFQIPNEPDNLDLQTNGTILGGYLCDQIYGKLVCFDKDSNVVGELAESWEWNDDFTQITFTLRDGIKFSDGSDITSEDVAYSFTTEAAKANTYLAPITSIETPDAKTVVLNLNASNSSMLKYLTTYHTGILPKGSLEATDINRGATAYSGPYMVDKWELGQSLVLKANPNWYNAANVAISEVDYSFIGDENSALVALESGQIDFMWGGNGLSPSIYESVEANEDLGTVFADQDDAGMLCLNFTMPELADVNVRQAINFALDREAITKVSVVGQAAGNVFTAEYFGDDYVAGHDAPAQDLEKAKEYLSKSGYPDGFAVEVLTPVMYSKAASIIQDELSQIGITVDVKEVDTSVWVDAVIKGDYQIGFMTFANLINDMTGFINMFDPAASLHFNKDTDDTSYKMLAKALTVDGADRTAVLSEFADYCEENLPYIGLWSKNIVWGQSAALTMDKPTASGYDLASMSW